MKKHCSFTMMFLLFIVLARPVTAGDGWSMSSLNPFKKASTQQRARASVSDESVKKSVFPRVSMPNWNTKSPAPKRRTEPSTFAKIGQGTKDFFGKTKDVLTPWSKSSKKKSSSSQGRSASKSSFFTSWLPHKKEPKKDSRTVKDFLAQPRPGF